MNMPALPFAAKIVSWNEADQLGLLRSETGFELKFGASACRFRPALGLDCWVIELKPDLVTKGVRAKIVNLTGASDVTPAEAARLRSETMRLEEEQEQERERIEASRPHQQHFDLLRAQRGFAMPPLYARAYSDGAFALDGSRRPLYIDLEWFRAYDIVRWLEPAREEPLDEREINSWDSISMDEVARTFRHDVPIAGGGARGWWVFRSDLGEGDMMPVFFCENTGEREGYAPTFEGFLYRMLLESAVEEPADLGENIAVAVPYLRAPWVENLRGLRNGVTHEEIAAIVRRDLTFPYLDTLLTY